MSGLVSMLWNEEQAQSVGEYAVMLAMVLMLVVATLTLISHDVNELFSKGANSLR